MNRPRCRIVLFAAVGLLAADAGAEPTYKVQFDRPVKVGQQFAVTATADVTDRARYAVGRRSQTNEAGYAAELSGTERVDAVAAKVGLPSKVTLTIDKFDQDGADLLPLGTVVVLDHTAPAMTITTAADGKPLDPAKAAVLAILLPVEAGDRAVSDDAMFGTAVPQPVGGTWSADPAKVAAMLAEANLPFVRDGLTATAKLVSAKAVNGLPAAEVETTIAADRIKPGVKLPNGTTIASGSVRGTVTYTLPTDPALPVAVTDEHTTLTLKLVGDADHPKLDGLNTSERTIHRTMTPKK